jgi:hypothetical protein
MRYLIIILLLCSISPYSLAQRDKPTLAYLGFEGDLSVDVTNNPLLIERMRYAVSAEPVIDPLPNYIEAPLNNQITTCKANLFIEGQPRLATVKLYAQEYGGYLTVRTGQGPPPLNLPYIYQEPFYRYTYLWSNGQTTPLMQESITQTTVYTVTVTDPVSGCSEVQSFTVKVPTAEITHCDENDQINANIEITITDGTPPYQLYVDGGLVDNTTNDTVTFFITAGVPTLLQIVTAEGCSFNFNYLGNPPCSFDRTEDRKAQVLTEMNHQIELYPNPANDRVSLSYRFGTLEAVAQVAIFDVQGKEVFHQNLKGMKGETDISTAQWSPGVYICKILDGNRQISVQKLVITR